MAKVQREVVVTAITELTPHLRRISFGGDSLQTFPVGQETAYIKFAFPSESEGGRTRMRSYTVRHFSLDDLRLDVDFALHDVGGPATRWAEQCKVGDTITMAGPGPTKRVDLGADWFFLVGDMSALPAIAANIDALPSSAKGHVVVEILSEEDKLDLGEPSGLEVTWVVNPHPESGSGLIDAVRERPWHDVVPAIWSACEFGKMKLLRTYFSTTRQVAPEHRYISSYWKICASDEDHKKAKSEDTPRR